MSDQYRECPKCGRPFEKFSAGGRIGFCSYHQEWFPCEPGASPEASEANRMQKEEELRKKQEEKKQEERRKRAEAGKHKFSVFLKLFLLAVAAAAIAAGVFWFRILPQQNYATCDALFKQGEYQQAKEGFEQLSGYGDSAKKAELCEVLLLLREESDVPFMTRYQNAFEMLLVQEDADEGMEVLLEAIETMDYGEARIELRQFVMEALAGKEKWQQEQADKYREDLVKCLQEWRTLHIDAQEVLELLDYGRSLGGAELDLDVIGQEALLEAVSQLTDVTVHEFVDWNGDGRTELLTGTKEGKLELYAYDTEVRCVWNSETVLPEVSTEVWDNYVFAVAEDLSAFCVYTYGNGQMTSLMQVDGAVGYERTDTVIRYGISLGGSIERQIRYEYDLSTPEQAPAELELNWQQEDYPYPDSAQDVVRRYFEAKGYGIEEEAQLLVGTECAREEGFSLGKAEELLWPEDPVQIEVGAYDTFEEIVLFEVQYLSSEKREKIYAAAVKEGQWKIAGFSDGFAVGMEQAEMNADVPVLSLNAAMTDCIEEKNETQTYRMLLSSSSKVQLGWKAGEKEDDTDAFAVSLFTATDMTKPVITYRLHLSKSSQISAPLFLNEGVYYVQVEVLKNASCEYQLTMQTEENRYVEREGNDYAETANTIELNQSYAGSLYEKNDVDYYAFSLEEAGAVHLNLEASPQGRDSVVYEVTLYNGQSGKTLTAFQMQGDVMTAVSGTVYLGAGVYGIKINKGTIWSSGAYQLTVGFEAADKTEQESNDSPETATAVQVNEAVTGSFGKEKDVDCYTFTLDGDMVIQPKLTFDPLETSAKTYVLSILNGTEILHTAKISGKESGKVIAPLALKAGTYTAKLENPSFALQDYTLTIAAVQADLAEAEPNDTLAKGTRMELNQKITGVLTTEEDVDIYKLVLSEETTACVSFEFPEGIISGQTYTIILEQGGKKLWSATVSGESPKLGQNLQIPSGEYYLRVKPVNWCSAVYQIAVSEL